MVALFFMSIFSGLIGFYAIFCASRELKETSVAVPERVLQDKKKREVKELPKGETIDDILGVLPPRNERDQSGDDSEN